MYADPTGHKGEWWNPGTWADNFVTGIKSISGSNLKSDLEVIKQQNEEGSFNRIIGEVVGGTAYNYKEGYDVIVSGTKEDRRQAFDIIDKNGTTSQSIVAHTSEYIVNGVIAPVRKLFEIPSNAIKTGLKFGWSSDNPLEIVPNTITGVGAGLVGGVLNVPHKDYQFNYNEEWLTKSVSEAWTYAYPESEEYFNTHPLARSVVDSTELVFYVATIKVMQLNQPYDITREANLNNRALSNSKYNTKTTNIDSNKITSEETPKTWTSPDKYVGETANAIEAQYQGKVVNVNKPVYRSDGTLLTDFDIELDNIVIQVKSGGANRLTTQILRTAGGTTKEVIGFAPDLNPSSALVKNASKQGINVFTSLEDLLEYLK
jgi:hypothetical protein